MSKVDEIKEAIESLPDDEYEQLRHWFTERDWQKWDQSLEEDVRSGKLDFLRTEAFQEKKQGKLKNL